MDYKSMTVAQLTAEAKARGVNVHKGMKKADIIALLEKEEPLEVDAEVIEDEGQDLSVHTLPGQISANFDALEARVDAILKDYEGWRPSADSAEDVRACADTRKYLNGLAKQIDERRKAVKNEYLRPLNAFEGRSNAIRDKIKSTVARIQAVEKEADEARKREKENALREHYQEVAGLLADVVPYEAIADQKWLNKSPHLENCKRELEGRCRKVATDWDALKAQELGEFYEQAEVRFFQTLDLGEAISWAHKLAEDKRRIDAMKSELDSYKQEDEPEPDDYQPAEAQAVEAPTPAQPAPQPVPVPAQPTPVPVQPQPVQSVGDYVTETMAKQIAQELAAFDPALQSKVLEAIRLAKATPAKPPVPCVMVIDSATTEQMQAVGKLCGLVGITGVFKRGTLAEVCQRTYGMVVING